MLDQFFIFAAGLTIIFVFVSTFVVSMMLAYSLVMFRRIEGLFNFDLFARTNISTIETNEDRFDAWVMQNNRMVGLVLAVLSLVDLMFCLRLLPF